MFDRFTAGARRAMGLARNEAMGFRHQYIGTTHLLLALASSETGGLASDVLYKLAGGYVKLHASVSEMSEDGPLMITMGQLPFTPRLKRVMEEASKSAQSMGVPYIGSEHLLLGILDEGSNAAVEALVRVGTSPEAVGHEVLESLVGLNKKKKKEVVNSFDEYQRFTGTTAVYPKKGDGDPLALSYCALGLTEEAGEVAGKLKKRIRIGGFEALAPGTTILKSKNGSTYEESYEDFRESVKKEIGDVLWYAARLADEFDLKLSEVVGCNIEKLTRRRREGTIHGEGDNR